jgi:hypothetical protein
LIHAALVTSANVADSATGLSLPAGADPAQAPKARDFINRRYRHRGVVDESVRAKNRAKSKVRAKIEHSMATRCDPELLSVPHAAELLTTRRASIFGARTCPSVSGSA